MKFFNNRILVIVSLFLMLAVIANLTIDYQDITPDSQSSEKTWQLSSLNNKKADLNDKKLLDRLNIWNSTAKSMSVATILKHWQLKGVIFDSGIAYALVLIPNSNNTVKYKVDQLLPNGEKLIAINADSISFETEGKTVIKKLYETGDTL